MPSILASLMHTLHFDPAVDSETEEKSKKKENKSHKANRSKLKFTCYRTEIGTLHLLECQTLTAFTVHKIGLCRREHCVCIWAPSIHAHHHTNTPRFPSDLNRREITTTKHWSETVMNAVVHIYITRWVHVRCLWCLLRIVCKQLLSSFMRRIER